MSPFKHDVFLSFRGVDTRLNFADHLYRSLNQAGIRAFRDSENLEKGVEINTLVEEIELSEMFIPIISGNYASSEWCLMELEKMVEIWKSSSDGERVIIPVFYHVSPAEVSQQTGAFGSGLKGLLEDKSVELCHGKKVTGTAEHWRDILATVESLGSSGFQVEKDDGHEVIIKKIVQKVMQELPPSFMNTLAHQIGIQERIRKILKYWEIEDNDVRMLVIHGLAGVGKTTIAKAIHKKIQSKFAACCFISDTSETASLPGGILSMQNRLFSAVSGGQSLPSKDRAYGVCLLEQALGRNKVLIVLDDVNDANQITELGIKQSCMRPGSRLIVTTRDRQVITTTSWKESHTFVYEQAKLNPDQSLEFFSWHAFHKDHPNDGFEELSKQMVEATDELPLAIEVMGSALCGDCDKQAWSEMIKSLQTVANHDIHGKLKLCYHKLNDHAKAIFLDTACFFNGYDWETAILVWRACEFSSAISLRTLERRSLIKIEGCVIKMHRLLQETAWHILRETQPNPDKRSRLWIAEEIIDVIERKEGTREIEAINLDLGKDAQINTSEYSCNAEEEAEKRILKTDGFHPLIKLRLLRINAINLVGDYQMMPEQLKFLSWQRCPLEFLPDDLYIREVVALDLSCSSVVQLTKEKVLVGSNASKKVFAGLKVLYLSACDRLTTTPNFSSCKSLEKLFLDQCHSLMAIDESIQELTSLVFLSFEKCTKLKELPDCIAELSKLEHLDVSFCTNLEKLPESIHKMKSLKMLLATCCLSMKEIPSSIFEMPRLLTLSLVGCIKLLKLPKVVVPCESSDVTLQYLYLPNCTKLKELPENISQSRSMRYLDMSGCVSWKGHSLRMESLQWLHLGSSVITHLPDSLDTLTKLRILILQNCCRLQELPEYLGNLLCLESLSIYGAPIRELPCSIGSLSRLEKLCIVDCSLLKSLPESVGHLLSLTEMVVQGSNVLEELPNAVGELTKLEVLDLNENSELKRLPDTIGCATSVVELRLDGTQIQELPESLVCLRQLEVLSVRDCPRLLHLPSWVESRDDLRLLHGSTHDGNLQNMEDAGRDIVLASMMEAFQKTFGREDVLNRFVGRVLNCSEPESDKELQPREIFLNLLQNNYFEGFKFSLDCDDLTYDNFLHWKLKECFVKVASMGCPDMSEEHILSLIPSQSTSGIYSYVGDGVAVSGSSSNSMPSQSVEARILEHFMLWLPLNWEESIEHLSNDLLGMISRASNDDIRDMKDLARKVGRSQLVTNILIIKVVRLLYFRDFPVSAAELRFRQIFQRPFRELLASSVNNVQFPRYPINYNESPAGVLNQSAIDLLDPNIPVLMTAFVQMFLLGEMSMP